MLSRRGLFGVLGGGLLVSAAPAALMWHESPFNKDRIIAKLIARVDSHWDDADMRYSASEVEDYKKCGGWPEYQV